MPTARQVDGVARAFALGAAPVVDGPPSRGELGQVWRVRTDTGCWAVKELFVPQREDAAASGAQFQDAAVAAGVPAPQVVRSLDDRVVHVVDGSAFRVFSWVDLCPADPGVDAAAVGAVVAAVHRLAHPSEGRADAWFTEPVGAARWSELLKRLDAARSPLLERVVSLRDDLLPLEALLEQPSTLQRLHLDLWADNLRATSSGGLVVIDWDNSGPGDPRQELAAVLFEYGFQRPDRARTLADAYAAAGGSARVTRAEDFSMAVAQLTHILVRQCGLWLSATSAEERRRAESAVAEFLDRRLTRDVIEELVQAVS